MVWLGLFLALLGSGEAEAPQGRILQLHGRGFSFQVMEPEGWVLDTRSAPQIANFIFHPKGTNWRRAEAIIVARFSPRFGDQTLDAFVASNQEQFFVSCPTGTEKAMEGIEGQAVDPFRILAYECPGVRREMVAVAEYPGYFVVFSLSGRNETDLQSGFGPLRDDLQSFRWNVVPREHPWVRPQPRETPASP